MPVPPCFHLADTVFPRVRQAAARRLVEQGWSQTRTAKALGVSQAMVSKYVAAPPGDAGDPLVERLVTDLVHDLDAPEDGPSRWCAVLGTAGARPGGQEALEDLLAAQRLLARSPPARLMPQVGLNMVRALPDARGAQDILGYPARILLAGDRLVVPSPPAPGASGHLARCLLHLRRDGPGPNALANVRGGPDVARVLQRCGEPVANVPADAPAEADVRFQWAARAAKPPIRFIHDPGAVGLEPCLYVAGPDAGAVVRAILTLHENLVEP